jgi:hypothetical protein
MEANVLAPVKTLTKTMNLRNSFEPQIGSKVFPIKRTATTLTIACGNKEAISALVSCLKGTALSALETKQGTGWRGADQQFG